MTAAQPLSPGSLDANIVLRLLLDDVPEQSEAVITLLEDAASPFVISDIAVVEVVFVLCRHYQFTRAEAAEAIETLMTVAEVEVNERLFRRALPLFVECPKLSFEDCCLAALAELADAVPLWTFDKKLANQSESARLLVPSQP
ncbi:PIN domain-containing protein [Nocardia sp. NPDC058640]|uniref:PIN domain-containing protein n=1 Tax=Nocardia sp. NPDC058640 TaxID=3346571 RepID=UPI00366259F1